MNDIEVEDCAAISLELADGSLATITATLGSEQEITRHRFHFANLSAESGTSAYENSADPWDIQPDDEQAAAAIAEVLDGWEPRAEGWWGQFERFGDWLDGRAPDCRSPSPTPARRSSSSPPCTTRPPRRRRRAPPLPDHPLYGGWLP